MKYQLNLILLCVLAVAIKGEASSSESTSLWQLNQVWSHFLFAHWQVKPSDLDDMLPQELELDLWHGKAYISIVSFEMTEGTFSPLRLPIFSAFPQVNVRTYVRYKNVPGVYFLSLDASNRLVTMLGHSAFLLPYHSSDLSLRVVDTTCDMQLERRYEDVFFHTTYSPLGRPFYAQQGSLDDFLTNRLRYFAVDSDHHVWKGEIWHKPWILRQAGVQIHANSMFSPWGLSLGNSPDKIHYSRSIDVKLWPLVRND